MFRCHEHSLSGAPYTPVAPRALAVPRLWWRCGSCSTENPSQANQVAFKSSLKWAEEQVARASPAFKWVHAAHQFPDEARRLSLHPALTAKLSQPSKTRAVWAQVTACSPRACHGHHERCCLQWDTRIKPNCKNFWWACKWVLSFSEQSFWNDLSLLIPKKVVTD